MNFALSSAQAGFGAYSGGTFIAPNEAHDRAYESELQNKTGVMVSVGTFRALARVAMGHFDELIIVDIDQAVTDFNQLNFKLIQESANSFEYLTKLLNRNADQSIAEQYRLGHITAEEMLKDILKSPKMNPNNVSVTLKALHKLMRKSHPDYESVGKSIIESFYKLSRTSSFNAHIFGSDIVFKKIKSMLKKHQIKAVTYDITTAPLEKIVTPGKTISVLDISNVFNYLGPAQFKNLIQSIRRWPVEAKARLFITLNQGTWLMGRKMMSVPRALKKALSQYSDGWGYFNFDLFDVMESIEQKPVKSSVDFGNRVSLLYEQQNRPSILCRNLFEL